MGLRRGLSTYLEVFLLIGLVTAGSALVFATTTQYGSALGGASMEVQNPTIQQGVNAAVERFILSNTGTVPFPSFSILTPGIANAGYYVTLNAALSGSPIQPSPSSGTAPSAITEMVGVGAGESVIVSILITASSEFTPGATYEMVVTTPAGAQWQQLVLAALA